jgi:WbqC-like protein family
MKIAIMQPYLFPYIGYYQLIQSVDKFLLLDDVAYINKGWINRNRIIINGEPQFFTMPVEGASQNKTINSLHIQQDNWKVKLDKTITMAYKKGIGYHDFYPTFKGILEYQNNNLSEYLANSIRSICCFLDIKTELIVSTSGYMNTELKGERRIIDLCKTENATCYVNASGGKSLYNPKEFIKHDICLNFLSASLAPYQQLGTREFLPGLSILDVLMNCSKSFVREQLNYFTLD